ncbi:MAG: NAD(P)/FAD-dependent oxidoreductase [Mesorhizobium sp.]|nr:NAD(P)/FAD-dependent oxidoreductase [Mesorhizobium sp.]MBN9241751.1 NAD(P)/FAD-dependent oxidoreductase [Mesorhizobium sp.]
MAATEPVMVIGAGASGLAAADALARRGLRALILEKEPHIAGPWRRRHLRLSLNTHRAFSSLPGLSYPPGTPAFPSREQVIAYLERYAGERGLSIEFGFEAAAVARDGDGWTVTAADGRQRHAAHVVFATGHDKVPWTPDWPGRSGFSGRLIHAADFGRVEDYEGKRVLVVGAGNSGFDVLNHLSGGHPSGGKAAAVWLSVRQGPSLLPKRIGQVAVHRFAGFMDRLPIPLTDLAIAATQRAVLGDIHRLGLPKASRGGATRLRDEQIAIPVDDGAVAAMRAGRIGIVAPLVRFDGGKAVLSDNSALDADVVIAATGYRTGLETLLGGLGVLDEATGRPLSSGGQPTGQKGLWFTGMKPTIMGHFHSAVVEGRALAAAIATGS